MDKKHQAFVCGYVYGHLEQTIENSKIRCVDLSSPAYINQAAIRPMTVLTQAVMKMNAAKIKTNREKLAELFSEIDSADLQLNLEKLALLRQEKGMTQKQLAEKAGILPTTLAKYEIGERSLRFAKAEVVQRLAEALECAMEDLL